MIPIKIGTRAKQLDFTLTLLTTSGLSRKRFTLKEIIDTVGSHGLTSRQIYQALNILRELRYLENPPGHSKSWRFKESFLERWLDFRAYEKKQLIKLVVATATQRSYILKWKLAKDLTKEVCAVARIAPGELDLP